MSLRRAKQAFTDAQKHLKTKEDPVMHDVVLGLLELVKGLQDDLGSVKNELSHLKSRIT